jgi:IS1 family transposase
LRSRIHWSLSLKTCKQEPWAERFNDPQRAATTRAEIDFLTAELATAYGLGRRPRQGADTTAKVRKAVTKCLRTSLARIQKAHLPLWRHLHSALKTGSKHINLRTRIKRLARRTICFSKTERMHDLVLGLFINRYEFGVSV